MLSEVAQVVAVEGDGLWVATERQSACQKCQAQRGCGQKLLASHLGETTYIKAFFTSDTMAQRQWAIGQEVNIGIAEGAFLLASLIAYMLPLLAMIAAMLGAYGLFATEVSAATGALLGLILGGFLARMLGRRLPAEGALCFQAQVISQVNLSPRHLIASQ